MRCFLTWEKRNARRDVARFLVYRKNSLTTKRICGCERDEDGWEERNATSMIPRAIIIMRILLMYVYLFIIFIFIMMYVRVRDQTLHCRLNKMRSHVNILRTYHKLT